jgi:DNA primase
VSGVETLVLRGTARGTFAVPREWTDLAEPVPGSDRERFFNFQRLLELTQMVEALDHPEEKGVDA